MWGFPTPIVVTYAYICFSGRSRKPCDSPSTQTGMLPYQLLYNSTASVVRLMPVYYPYPTARLVSCYALFK